MRDRNGYACKERTVKPSACDVFNHSEDVCETCKSGNFLSTNKKECLPFPSGDIGCRAWTTEEKKRVCTKCKEDEYFLEDKKCVMVASDKRDDNCIKVEAENRCAVCKSGYFLKQEAKENTTLENQCVDTGISNCEELSDDKNCSRCKSGFKIEPNTNGNNICKDLNNSDCIQWEGENCLAC